MISGTNTEEYYKQMRKSLGDRSQILNHCMGNEFLKDVENAKEIYKKFNNNSDNIKIVFDGTYLYMFEFFDNFKLKRYTKILEIAINSNIDFFNIVDNDYKREMEITIKMGLLMELDNIDHFEAPIEKYSKSGNKIFSITNNKNKEYFVYDFKDINEIIK